MRGLVAYDSSDEEKKTQISRAPREPLDLDESLPPKLESSVDSPPSCGQKEKFPTPGLALEHRLEPSLPVLGPLPLSHSPEPEYSAYPPLSPFTSERNLARDLTLPPVPNMNLPPSPPRCPAMGLNEKFEHFLKLKKESHHFNKRLDSLASVKNPSVMKNLLEFAGVHDDSLSELRSVYETSLSADILKFYDMPNFAFKSNMRVAKDKMRKEMDAEKAGGKRGREFAPATTSTRVPSNGVALT